MQIMKKLCSGGMDDVVSVGQSTGLKHTLERKMLSGELRLGGDQIGVKLTLKPPFSAPEGSPAPTEWEQLHSKNRDSASLRVQVCCR
jgi:hypothetical protein